MPPKSAESLLFHKKKSIKREHSTPSTASQGSQLSQSHSQSSLRKSATPRIQPTPPDADADDSSKLPEGEFAEYKLMSSALNGWKYDVMKFDSRKTVDIGTWEEPIKLNRKELRREESGPSTQVPTGPMLGPDGKPVVGTDGKVVMVDVDGRPIANNNNGGEAPSKEKDKGKAPGRKKFQKKTRQVFLVPEATRQLRREERYPWVMEDAKQNEMWVGKLEEVAKAETHALFMPAAQEVFKFVPANRWYKFQKKPKHYVPGLEEAEALMAKIQKNKDPERWLLHRRKGQAASAATSEMFKAEAENRVVSGSSPLVYSSGQSRAMGGRTLRITNRGPGGGGDNDEGVPRRKKEENDMEGDLDEQLFDEEFADDEEAGPADMDEEEAKELEERLKREYKSANKTREGYVDESESEDGESQLTKDGKSLKKLMRKLEKNAAYDSDEERNPYASSNEEEEEEEEPVVTTEAIQEQQPPQNKSRSASQQPTPKPSQPSANAAQNGSTVSSRATSPAPASMGGHSVVAKRATSPKVPKLKSTSTNGSRAGSGQGTGSRATSPVTGSRATSPVTPAKGPGSPTSNGQPSSNKRKATDDLGGAVSPGTTVNGMTAPPKPKKRKPLPAGPAPEGELEEKMLIEWLQNTPNATTRDCIQHFTPYLTTDAKKAKFTAMVKDVAQLRGGILVLRSRDA